MLYWIEPKKRTVKYSHVLFVVTLSLSRSLSPLFISLPQFSCFLYTVDAFTREIKMYENRNIWISVHNLRAHSTFDQCAYADESDFLFRFSFSLSFSFALAPFYIWLHYMQRAYPSIQTICVCVCVHVYGFENFPSSYIWNMCSIFRIDTIFQWLESKRLKLLFASFFSRSAWSIRPLRLFVLSLSLYSY